MVDIRPNVLPSAIIPLRSGDALIVDQGADGVRKTDAVSLTDSVAPVATQPEAVAGLDNTKRMTSLRTKQSIASEVGVSLASNTQGAKADSAVQSVNGKTGSSVTIEKGDVGLGNVSNLSPDNMPVSTATQTALDLKANDSVVVKTVNGISPVSGNVDVAGGIPDDGSVTNIKVFSPDTPDQGIDSNKVFFKRIGSGTVYRPSILKMSETLTPQDYGAIGDGTSSDNKLADAVSASVFESKSLIIPGDVPAGRYTISTPLIIDMSETSGILDQKRPAIRGESAGTTIIQYTGVGHALSVKGASSGEGHHSLVNISDIFLLGTGSTNLGRHGIYLDHQAYFRMDRVSVEGFDIALDAIDLEFSKFNECNLRWNNKGVFMTSRGTADPTSTLPNGNTFINCEITSNTTYGALIIGPCLFSLITSHVQYNGLSGGPDKWGIRVQDAGFQGGIGANVRGCYIEHNGGVADIYLSSDSFAGGPLINPVVHNIVGNSFSRATRSGTLPAPPAKNHIFCSFDESAAGLSFVNVKDNGFKYYNDYVPNINNKVIAFDPLSSVKMDPNHFYESGNLFMSSLEKPDFIGNKSESLITQSKVLPAVGWPGQILVNDNNGVPYIWTNTGSGFSWRQITIV